MEILNIQALNLWVLAEGAYGRSIIGMIVIGLIIGAIAKLLTPGRDPGGCIITMIIGIIGSVVATFIGQAIGWYRPGEPAGFIASVIGAILVLVIYHLVFRRGVGPRV